jgi:pyruvate dehydrogenase complex dehydrogenase (E1) component
MAASTYSIVLSNGQTISVYQAANQAVNTNPVVSMLGAAGPTVTTTDFSVQQPAYVVDVVVPATLTAGGVEVFNVTESRRTQRGWNNLETFQSTNTTRRPAVVMFRPGYIYRFVQTVTGNA